MSIFRRFTVYASDDWFLNCTFNTITAVNLDGITGKGTNTYAKCSFLIGYNIYKEASVSTHRISSNCPKTCWQPLTRTNNQFRSIVGQPSAYYKQKTSVKCWFTLVIKQKSANAFKSCRWLLSIRSEIYSEQVRIVKEVKGCVIDWCSPRKKNPYWRHFHSKTACCRLE